MDHTPLLVVPDILVAENAFLSIGGKEILKGMTMRAEKGCITGLLGRNGAGKSTMLQAVFGTRRSQECDVFLNGVKISKPYAVDGLLNYLPQKPFLPAGLTIRKIAEQYGVSINDISTYFPELEQDMGTTAGDLSGGRERLVSVAILLLADTRFTFLDEPFTHIMPMHVEQLKHLMAKQKEKKGIIITDHMYRHILDLSDRLFLVKDGKTIFIRDMQDLVLHGYVREFAE